MTGYQEILTDPSYAGRSSPSPIPISATTGVNAEDVESGRSRRRPGHPRPAAAVSTSAVPAPSTTTWARTLGRASPASTPARLTRILREKGAQNGAIGRRPGRDAADTGARRRRALCRAWRHGPGQGRVDATSPTNGQRPSGSWRRLRRRANRRFHVVAFDYGVKRNILRMLADRGCRVTVVPAQTTAEEALALIPTASSSSNGPGDPEPCDYAIKATRESDRAGIPMFGICLGHQMHGPGRRRARR